MPTTDCTAGPGEARLLGAATGPVAGETIKGVADVVLRRFVVAFDGAAELLAALDALVLEVQGVNMAFDA